MSAARRWRRRGPWTTRFEVRGTARGGEVSFEGDARIDAFWAAFPDARRVLELGSLEGGHTVQLARRALHVTGVEARPANVDRARFAASALGVTNVRFVVADVEVVGPGAFGSFDAVFCSALLYHLTRPAPLLTRLRDAAPAVYLWTHHAPAATARHAIDGTPGEWHDEAWLDDPTVGLGPRGFWPTLDAIVDALRAGGFDAVDVTEEEHPIAPAATVVARDTRAT